MTLSGRLLNPLGRLRSRLRFKLWTARTRLTLARQGCRVEIVAPHGAYFGTAPVVQPTLKRVSDGNGSRRGSLRIELGEWVHLGRGLTIEVLPDAESVLTLGDGVVCGTASRFTLFGGEVRLGARSIVREGAMVKSAGGRLVAGQHVELCPYTLVHCTESVEIGEHTVLAERVTVVDSDHMADGSDLPLLQQPLAVAPIAIGRNVFVGTNSVVLRGADIGANSLVAAGSVVRGGEYPAGWVVAGSPAEAIKPLPANAAQQPRA